MKLRHAELETCRQDPIAWTRTVLGGNRRVSMSFERIAVMSIYRYHKSGDAEDAVKHLERLAESYHLKNSSKREVCEEKIRTYFAWCETSRPVVVSHGIKIRLPLTGDVFLAGEVSRVDIDLESGGYRAVLLTDKELSVEQELRMPLLQMALANRFQRVISDISVGRQHVDASDVVVKSFSERRVKSAFREAKRLAEQIETLLR